MDTHDPGEIVDLEELAKAGKPVPAAARYRIRIDGEKFVVTVSHMTGRQLLELAGKTPPEQYKLFEKVHGGPPVEIGLDQTVDFRKHGVERFVTLPINNTEG
jgi:hypothetical protein